jgi:transcriptional regulator with XRE-family HTH domain
VTVGETLSRARRKRGLSVEDVAADTRIRATLISAIEADHFELCGGAVYARGHIKSIARVVGIEPEGVLGEFDTAHQIERVVHAVATTSPDHDLVSRAERHQPNWTVAMAAALVAICVLAAYGLVHHAGSTPTPRAQPPHPQSQQHSSTPTSPPPSSVAQLPTTGQATMLVRALNGRTWLTVTTKSGHTLFNALLLPGQHKVFTDRHGLAYVIGNAPVVDVVVNGNDIGSPPSSNVVARGSVIPGKGTVQQA